MFGNVDLRLGGAAEAVFDQHIEAAGGRFRGVRISSGWHEDARIHNVADQPGLLIDPRVKEGMAVVQRMGLSLDCWLYHTQLDEVAQVADAHPDLTIILNHVGSPILGGPYRGKNDEVFAQWKKDIARVSERGNVYVKLGALPIRMPSYEGDRTLPPSSEEVADAWRPWMETCIEAFGAERSMYESNFPVQKRVGVATRYVGMRLSAFLPARRRQRKTSLFCWRRSSSLSDGNYSLSLMRCPTWDRAKRNRCAHAGPRISELNGRL